MSKHEAYQELMTETDGNPTNLQVVEASITDLRQRQYQAYVESGLSEAEAVAMSGYTPKK
jgi:hypothetical protein